MSLIDGFIKSIENGFKGAARALGPKPTPLKAPAVKTSPKPAPVATIGLPKFATQQNNGSFARNATGNPLGIGNQSQFKFSQPQKPAASAQPAKSVQIFKIPVQLLNAYNPLYSSDKDPLTQAMYPQSTDPVDRNSVQAQTIKKHNGMINAVTGFKPYVPLSKSIKPTVYDAMQQQKVNSGYVQSNRQGLADLGKSLGGNQAIYMLNQYMMSSPLSLASSSPQIEKTFAESVKQMTPEQFRQFRDDIADATKAVYGNTPVLEHNGNKTKAITVNEQIPFAQLQQKLSQQAVDNIVKSTQGSSVGHFALSAGNSAMNAMGSSMLDKLTHPQGSILQNAQQAAQILKTTDPNHKVADTLGSIYGGFMGGLPMMAVGGGGVAEEAASKAGTKYLLDSEAELAKCGASKFSDEFLTNAFDTGKKLGLSDDETASIIKGTLKQNREELPEYNTIMKNPLLKSEGESGKLDIAKPEDKQSVEYDGGVYKDLKGKGGQVHHMPADSSSPYSTDEGPGIRMETADHKRTNSWGFSKTANPYRLTQRDLIGQGKFKEAQQMDIDDIHKHFGSKYDDAIKQMLEYTDKLLSKK